MNDKEELKIKPSVFYQILDILKKNDLFMVSNPDGTFSITEYKPEPAEPLIVKSGETWVAKWNDVDYLYCAECSSWKIENAETSFSNFTRGHFIIDGWKRFSEITLDDEIAKLRPMVQGKSRINNYPILSKLIYVDKNKYHTDLYICDICRLATAHELQETQK